MTKFRFQGGEDAITREIKKAAGEKKGERAIAERLHELVEKGRDYAASISPVDTGNFKDSWDVKDYEPRKEGDSPMSQLVNTDPAGEWIEYGTVRTPPHHTLASTRTYIERLAKDDEHHIG